MVLTPERPADTQTGPKRLESPVQPLGIAAPDVQTPPKTRETRFSTGYGLIMPPKFKAVASPAVAPTPPTVKSLEDLMAAPTAPVHPEAESGEAPEAHTKPKRKFHTRVFEGLKKVAEDTRERFNENKIRIATDLGVSTFVGLGDAARTYFERHEILTKPAVAASIDHAQYVDAFNRGNFPYFLIGTSLALIINGDLFPFLSPKWRGVLVGATVATIAATSYAVELAPQSFLGVPLNWLGTRDPGDIAAGRDAVGESLLLYGALLGTFKGIELAKKHWPAIQQRLQENKANKVERLFEERRALRERYDRLPAYDPWNMWSR